MTKNTPKIGKSIDKTSLSMSAASSAVMIGFSATIMTLIVTLVNNLEEFTNMFYVLLFYVLAIVFFIFATEFFILSSWNEENYETWGTIGSITYGLGQGWLIIGISLTFDLLINFTRLAYFTITLFLVGYFIYYLLRWKIIKNVEPRPNLLHWIKEKEPHPTLLRWKIIKKKEPHPIARIVARGFMILQIFIGYISIYMLN